MSLMEALRSNFTLQNLILKGVYIVFIAIVFEFAVWWMNRLLVKQTEPLLAADSSRDQNWRLRRRNWLRGTPKIVLRSVCYAVALVLVFSLFGAPVLELSLALAAAATIIGASMLPTFRDAAQGYSLLCEDALAIGDVVEINGHHGRIEKFSLRGLWLRDAAGRAHYLSHSDTKGFIVHSRHEEKARDDKTVATRKN